MTEEEGKPSLAVLVGVVMRDDDPDEVEVSLDELARLLDTAGGEVFARIEKTPTTTFLVPSIIPLIPGGSLYYTMNFALNKQWAAFSHRGFYTLQLALSLAVGIIAVTTLTRLLTLARKKLAKAEFFSHFH